MKLPNNIEGLIQAQNNSDSATFATYFTENATVSDEGSTYSGREAIEQWIQQAMQKYTMQLTPVNFNQSGTSGILTVEVTGSFPGSPAIMQYHLALDGALIRSLKITG